MLEDITSRLKTAVSSELLKMAHEKISEIAALTGADISMGPLSAKPKPKPKPKRTKEDHTSDDTVIELTAGPDGVFREVSDG